MPQFVVPQFIDVEDTIIGPITTRQFVMGVVAALFVFVSYKLADMLLFVIEAIVIVGLYALIAFIKINGRPTYYFLLSILQSLLRPTLRVWKREPSRVSGEKKDTEHAAAPAPPVLRKRLQAHSLSSLALLVDTGGKYRPEEILKKDVSHKS